MLLLVSKPIFNKRQYRVQFLIEYLIPPHEKLLKVPPKKSRPYGRSRKNMLEQQAQLLSILNLPEKKVRINNIVTNIGDLGVDGLEVV